MITSREWRIMASDRLLWTQLMYSAWYDSVNKLKISELHLQNTLSRSKRRRIGKGEALPWAFLEKALFSREGS